MKAAIFAVVSPLQYINALEAVHAFGLAPEQCYLALGESRKMPTSATQVRTLLDETLWRSIVAVTGSPAPLGRTQTHSEMLAIVGAKKYANAANQLIKRARQDCGEIGYLFLGDYRPRNFRHFIASIPEAELWLLDDGSATHQVVRFRKDPESPNVYARQFASWNKRVRLEAAMTGLKFAEAEELGFFTCYEIEAPPQDQVRKHSYERFREQYASCVEPAPEVWFLGANHSENGFTNPTRYMGLLRRVRSYYGSQKVVYLPHRGESPEKLESVSALGFEIRHHNLPIEIVVGIGGRFPRVIAGIASSAIDTLSVMLGDRLRVDVFRVAKGYCPGARWNHLRDVIEYHERDILGLTNFIEEDDTTCSVPKMLDLRVDASRVQGGSGYYRGRDQVLRGVQEAHALPRSEAGTQCFQLDNTPLNRAWRRGDRVEFFPSRGPRDPAETGVVRELTPNGLLTLESDQSVTLQSGTPWVIQEKGPRIEYLPGKRTIAGCLIEPGTSNWLISSTRWDGDPWSLEGVRAIGIGQDLDATLVRSPRGAFDAQFLCLEETHGQHRISQIVRGMGGGSRTLSVYARTGGIDAVFLAIEHVASESRCRMGYSINGKTRAWIEERNGIFSEITSGAQSAGDQWWRCHLTVDLPPGDCQVQVQMASLVKSESQFTGDGCSGVYLWGPQLELASAPTSYLPTTSEVGRRVAEQLELETITTDAILSVEFSLPVGRTTIPVIAFSDGCTFSFRGSEGRLFALVKGEEHVGYFAPLGRGTPVVCALGLTDSSMSIAINGELVLRDLPRPGDKSHPVLSGGPFHARRVHVLEGRFSEDDLMRFSTVEVMDKLELNPIERTS